MELSEKEIEGFIFNDLIENSGSNLEERGLELPSFNFNIAPKWFKQLNIEPYGIIDIVGFYRLNGAIHVDLIELKAVKIDSNHFEQIARYRKGIEVYLRNTFKKPELQINCILIGNGYDGLYIQNISPISVASFEYGINGFSFHYTDSYPGWAIRNCEKSFRKQKTNGQKIH